MLVRDPTATSQTRGIIGGSSEETFLPADLDGIIPPPAEDPNHFVAFPQGSPVIYKIWAYHVDFTTPANSTFAVEASVKAASFTSLCSTTRDCQAVTGWAAKQLFGCKPGQLGPVSLPTIGLPPISKSRRERHRSWPCERHSHRPLAVPETLAWATGALIPPR
jgi:hypothetical protein